MSFRSGITPRASWDSKCPSVFCAGPRNHSFESVRLSHVRRRGQVGSAGQSRDPENHTFIPRFSRGHARSRRRPAHNPTWALSPASTARNPKVGSPQTSGSWRLRTRGLPTARALARSASPPLSLAPLLSPAPLPPAAGTWYGRAVGVLHGRGQGRDFQICGLEEWRRPRLWCWRWRSRHESVWRGSAPLR